MGTACLKPCGSPMEISIWATGILTGFLVAWSNWDLNYRVTLRPPTWQTRWLHFAKKTSRHLPGCVSISSEATEDYMMRKITFPIVLSKAGSSPTPVFELNENGLVTGVYPKARKALDGFANLKSNNYLPYTMAALHAQKQHWNDAFVLNTTGNICDATIANVFIVKNQVVFTCPLQEGCVAGVMRRFLLQNMAANGFSCQEQIITVEDLLTANEVFLTNTIKGMRWVAHCDEVSYTNRLTTKIFQALLKK